MYLFNEKNIRLGNVENSHFDIAFMKMKMLYDLSIFAETVFVIISLSFCCTYFITKQS